MAIENVIKELLDEKGPTSSGVPGFGPDYSGYDPGGNGWTRGDSWPHVRVLRLDPEGVANFTFAFPPEADNYYPGVENWLRDQGQVLTGWTCVASVIGKNVRFGSASERSWTNGAVAAFHVPVYERQTGHVVTIFGRPNQEFMLWFMRHLEVTRDGHRIPPGAPVPDDDEHSEV